MANIKINLDHIIHNGSEAVFIAPCDCSEITGIIITHLDNNGGMTSDEFRFKDAHGHDLSELDNLFTKGVYVKIILNVTDKLAYIQNADTNSYIESRIKKLQDDDLVKHSNGSKYSWGMDDIGVFLELVDSNQPEEDIEEEIQIATLVLGDEDTGDYLEINGEIYNLENIVDDDSELQDGSYNFDLI